VSLFHRDLGGAGNPDLVILHGMLGSSRNWATAGAGLSEMFHVSALDLPNHGRSPQRQQASVGLMADEVLRWMDSEKVESASVMGHSLGGKVAMRLAVDYPGRVDRLFVLDIMPKAYPTDPTALDAMLSVDLATIRSRADAEAALESAIPSQAHRLFLLTNLVRMDDNTFAWQVPLETIRGHLADWTPTVLAASDVYRGPTLFVAGGRSDYVAESDIESARRHFPRAKLEILPESGHNVHIDGGRAFVDVVRNALERE